MKTTIKNTSFAAIALLCASPPLLADVRNAGPGCVPVPLAESGKTVIVCSQIFPSLWRDAASLDGAYIRLTGFVAGVRGNLYLFASKDLYLYSAGRGGVELDFEPGERERFDRSVAGDHAITVMGKFIAGDKGIEPGSLGRILVLRKHYWPQEMPGERPILPPD